MRINYWLGRGVEFLDLSDDIMVLLDGLNSICNEIRVVSKYLNLRALRTLHFANFLS